ncbi:hypothetical protein FTO70_03520 [Methanosarcina sp. KYL-1]|uniref:hypothetical protein n=1 Tax=Methanosarcina sp. KYL-1 TaxID=2602068 RepID=UPI0021014F46|nr:hypothetical protein [Methanosarcina sp. KYL-1]MCQ1534775.1 hypothetical protein [Methanosarcina sp. KYL-1]
MQAAGVTDPTGDFDYPDITGLASESRNGYLYVEIDFAESLEGEDCAGAVFIDTDRDPKTGYNEGSGADYVYAFNVMSIIYSDPIVTATLNDDPVSEDTLFISGNQLYIEIPLRMLGNDDGDMDIFVASHMELVKALFFDRAPDYGVLNTETGKVSIPVKSGDLEGSFQDRSGDSEGSDITGIDTWVHDGVFELLLTYKNNVNSGGNFYGEDLNGWVFIDSDQNIATGFTNTEQAPPSFGVDYRLDYTIGSMLGTDASLVTENKDSELTKMGYTQTGGIPLGVPYNDAMFAVSKNQVFFRIPLEMLGSDDGKMSLVADSFTVDEALSGKMDRVPDFGEGALDTGTGRLNPLFAYTENPSELRDSSGDSTGFGYDGDDLTSVEIGYSGNIMLLTITYKELELDDGAITTVFFDTARDASNLPEYMLVYSLYNGKLDADIFGDVDGKYGVREAGHLISMKGNRMYLSIPLEFLKDEGNMDIYVETALVPSKSEIPLTEMGREWMAGEETKTGTGEIHINPDKFGRTIYDRAPDTGFISISKQGTVQTTRNQQVNPEANPEDPAQQFPAAGQDAVGLEGEAEGQNPESPGPGTLLSVLALFAGVFALNRKDA